MRYLFKGEKGTLSIPRGDNVTAKTSTLSQAGAFRNIGLNVNSNTLPIIRNLTTQSMSEFLPLLWEEICADATPSQKALALRVYLEVQEKCRNGI